MAPDLLYMPGVPLPGIDLIHFLQRVNKASCLKPGWGENGLSVHLLISES